MIETHIILNLLKALCPILMKLADKTDNKVDNLIINFVCDLVGAEEEDEKVQVLREK